MPATTPLTPLDSVPSFFSTQSTQLSFQLFCKQLVFPFQIFLLILEVHCTMIVKLSVASLGKSFWEDLHRIHFLLFVHILIVSVAEYYCVFCVQWDRETCC